MNTSGMLQSYHYGHLICKRPKRSAIQSIFRKLNLFLKYIISLSGYEGYWINGNDIAEEGAWVWASDNRPFNYTAWYTRKASLLKKRKFHEGFIFEDSLKSHICIVKARYWCMIFLYQKTTKLFRLLSECFIFVIPLVCKDSRK